MKRLAEISADQAQVIRLLPEVVLDLCEELKRSGVPGSRVPRSDGEE